jgi:hypothetical protein
MYFTECQKLESKPEIDTCHQQIPSTTRGLGAIHPLMQPPRSTCEQQSIPLRNPWARDTLSRPPAPSYYLPLDSLDELDSLA